MGYTNDGSILPQILPTMHPSARVLFCRDDNPHLRVTAEALRDLEGSHAAFRNVVS
jgi:hypothetical protein